MYLSDIDLYAHDEIAERYQGGFVAKFRRQACCIVDLFRFVIRRRVVTKDTRKLLFEFSDAIDGPPRELIELDCKWPFDFSRYISLTDAFEKKRMIADALRDALVWSAGQLGVSAEPFHDAHREAFQRDLKLEGLTRQSWISPDGKHRIRIFFIFDIDGIHLFAVLFKNRSKRELGRVRLGIGVSQTGSLEYCLKQGRWSSNTEFQLTSTDWLQQTWKADFSELINQVD
jgi:hypothetical protein